MISTLFELHEALKLGQLRSEYQYPEKYINVAEIHRAYLWEDVISAAEKLTDSELKAVLSCSLKIRFHNNATNGHASMGAVWTITEFIERNGSEVLLVRISSLN